MKDRRVIIGILLAALLWFVMFSPWTAPHVNFWLAMTLSAITLTAYAFAAGGCPTLRPRTPHPAPPVGTSAELRPEGSRWQGWVAQVALGVLLAAVLWGVFWVGDKVSQWLFGFARPQVDAIYTIKEGTSPWLIGCLLLFVIGPAEELFWRAFVQRRLMTRCGANAGFVVATLCYTLVHIWSLNFMLVMAALACGVIWGGLYRLRPDWLPALIISHALWDAAAFVVFPF